MVDQLLSSLYVAHDMRWKGLKAINFLLIKCERLEVAFLLIQSILLDLKVKM